MHTDDLDRLGKKIDRLKREYDLFLAGKRRGEPVALHDEIQRAVLGATRHPWTATAQRFRAQGLAHRFQALEAQVRHLLEMRNARARDEEAGAKDETATSCLFDRASLDDDRVLTRYVDRIQRAVAKAMGDRGGAPSAEELRGRILAEVRRRLSQPEVVGVRFSVVEGEAGPKLRGEVVRQSAASG